MKIIIITGRKIVIHGMLMFFLLVGCIKFGKKKILGVNPLMGKVSGLWGHSKLKQMSLIDKSDMPVSYGLLGSEIKDLEENDPKLLAVGYPCIIKPDSGQQAKGVCRIDAYQELKRLPVTLKKQYIIQEYIAGKEYKVFIIPDTKEYGIAIEGVVKDKVVQLATPSSSRFFKLTKNFFSSFTAFQSIPIEDLSDDLKYAVYKWSKALHVRYGRFDIIVDDTGRPIFIEFNGLYSTPVHLYAYNISYKEFFEGIVRLFTSFSK